MIGKTSRCVRFSSLLLTASQGALSAGPQWPQFRGPNRCGDKPVILARTDLGERLSATPAIVDNKLYVRTANHLWAFGK